MSVFSALRSWVMRRRRGTSANPAPELGYDLDDLEGLEQKPQEKSSLRNILRAATYVRPYKKFAVFSIILMILSVGASLLAPWPLKVLIDNVLEGYPLPPLLAGIAGPLAEDRFSLLIMVVVAGFLIAFLSNALGVVENYVNTSLEQRMILDFRSDLFRHAEHLSLAFYDRKRTGGLMNRINMQASSVGSITMTIPQIGQSFLILLGMLWIIYRIDPWMALLSVTVVPILYYSFSYYTRYIEPHLRRVKGMEGQSRRSSTRPSRCCG